MIFKKKLSHEKLLEIIEALEAEQSDLHMGKIHVRMDPIKIPDRDISKCAM